MARQHAYITDGQSSPVKICRANEVENGEKNEALPLLGKPLALSRAPPGRLTWKAYLEGLPGRLTWKIVTKAQRKLSKLALGLVASCHPAFPMLSG